MVSKKPWPGRKTIEAFPEDKLFQFSVGGMRPFAEMAWEFIRMAVPIVEGVFHRQVGGVQNAKPSSKSELLRLWDEQTAELNNKFPKIPPHRFSEVDNAFGQWEMPGLATIQYAIDNEIHHRGQGYVYLRTLGGEPPPFWERDLRPLDNGCHTPRIRSGTAAPHTSHLAGSHRTCARSSVGTTP